MSHWDELLNGGAPVFALPLSGRDSVLWLSIGSQFDPIKLLKETDQEKRGFIVSELLAKADPRS